MTEQQNNLYLDEKNLIENNQVYFELSKPVDDHDFDVLEMFLESKRQSGGGEILNIKYLADKYTYKPRACSDASTTDSGGERIKESSSESQDQARVKEETTLDNAPDLDRNFSTVSDSSDCRFNRTKRAWAFVAIYEEREVKERIIAKRFFKFKDYFLRASEHGYFNQTYEPKDNLVIVENINPEEDRYVIELYAEHLQPDNELLDIVKSDVFERTFVLRYKSSFEWDKLMLRYQKKNQLRNKRLTLSQAFETNSIFLRSKSGKPLSDSSYQKLIFDACFNLNKSAETSGDQTGGASSSSSAGFSVVFSDQIGDCVLLQFENGLHLTNFMQANQEEFKKQDIIMEQVANFSLLKPFVKEIETAKTESTVQDQIKTAPKEQNKSTQTDLTMKTMTSLLLTAENASTNSNPAAKQAPLSASMPKQQVPQPTALANRRNSESSVPIVHPKTKSPPLTADSKLILIDPNDPHKIYVNPEEPLSIGILNARQLLHDLEFYLKKTSSAPKIDAKKDPLTQMDQLLVVIQFVNRGFRDKLTHLMHEFNSNHFKHEIISVKEHSKCAKLDAKSISQLQKHLLSHNSRYPALYLVYNQQLNAIYSYGASKPFSYVIQKLKGYLANEFAGLVQLNKTQSANLEPENSGSETSRPSSAESNRKGLTNQPGVKAVATAPIPYANLIMHGQVVVFINSYDADVNKFKLFDASSTSTKLLIHKITAKEHPVLMKCLYYCSKILQDLLTDLYQFELNLDLYVDLEPSSETGSAAVAPAAADDKARFNQTLCVVMNRTANPALVLSEQEERLIKLKVLNLLDQYEKNRLNHSVIKLGENLNQLAFMTDLVSKLTGKMDLAKLMKLIDAQYDSTKVVHLEMNSTAAESKTAASNPSRQFEIYGYLTAVQQTGEYVQSSLGKLNALLSAKMQGKLEFKLTLKKNASVIVFFKFDEIFYKDFQAKLADMDAFVIKLSNDAPSEGQAGAVKPSDSAGFGHQKTELTLQFGCTNAKLRSKKLENWDDVNQWRLRVDQFIEKYLSYFSTELIDMPFRRDDPKASSLLYDRNMIDIIWMTNQKLQVTGVKEEIQRLRQRILQISYTV